jgi:hypothetical protein
MAKLTIMTPREVAADGMRALLAAAY